jgi:hypothetical protein
MKECMTIYTYDDHIRASQNERHGFFTVVLPYLVIVGMGVPLAVALALTSSGMAAPSAFGGSWFWVLGAFGLFASCYVAAQMWPAQPKSRAAWDGEQEQFDHVRFRAGISIQNATPIRIVR